MSIHHSTDHDFQLYTELIASLILFLTCPSFTLGSLRMRSRSFLKHNSTQVRNQTNHPIKSVFKNKPDILPTSLKFKPTMTPKIALDSRGAVHSPVFSVNSSCFSLESKELNGKTGFFCGFTADDLDFRRVRYSAK